MIALYDFEPKFCPACGNEHNKPSSRYLTDSELKAVNRAIIHDYQTAHCSFTCKCGLVYAYVESEKLKEAATAAGSDLAQFA
jgi:hypothetical protein